jgi:hypothetical protein
MKVGLAMLSIALMAVTDARARPAFERVTISSVRECRIGAYPTLDRMADGRLLCVYSAIDDKATGGKAIIRGTFSTDHGKTWGTPRLSSWALIA